MGPVRLSLNLALCLYSDRVYGSVTHTVRINYTLHYMARAASTVHTTHLHLASTSGSLSDASFAHIFVYSPLVLAALVAGLLTVGLVTYIILIPVIKGIPPNVCFCLITPAQSFIVSSPLRWLTFRPQYRSWRASGELSSVIHVRSYARFCYALVLIVRQVLTVSMISGWSLLTFVLGRYSDLGYIKGFVGGTSPVASCLYSSLGLFTPNWWALVSSIWTIRVSIRNHGSPACTPRTTTLASAPQYRCTSSNTKSRADGGPRFVTHPDIAHALADVRRLGRGMTASCPCVIYARTEPDGTRSLDNTCASVRTGEQDRSGLMCRYWIVIMHV